VAALANHWAALRPLLIAFALCSIVGRRSRHTIYPRPSYASARRAAGHYYASYATQPMVRTTDFKYNQRLNIATNRRTATPSIAVNAARAAWAPTHTTR
jgi:hypothetical protein